MTTTAILDAATARRVLNVAAEADKNTLRKAFRRVAMRTHPDRNPGDPQAALRFHEAKAAYDLLQSLHASSAPEPPERFDDPLFAFFHSAATRYPEPVPDTVRARLTLNVRQALLGAQVHPRALDADLRDLPHVTRVKIPMLRIAPRTEPGTRLYVPNAAQDPHAPRGVEIRIELAPDPVFTIKDGDIHRPLTVTLADAELGLAVPTTDALGKTVRVRPAPGTRSGDHTRLPGHGLHPTGSLVCRVTVRGENLLLRLALRALRWGIKGLRTMSRTTGRRRAARIIGHERHRE